MSATLRQLQILRYVRDFGIEHGVGPSLRELCETFRTTSTNGMSDQLKALVKHGLLKPRRPKTARSLVLTEAGHVALNRRAA